ncbi:hypothetical protein R6Q57_000758 [Mikania cordata]
MATPFKWRRRRGGGGFTQSPSLDRKIRVFFSRKYVFRCLLLILAVIAILPPVYFHFSLRRFHQLELKRCSWLNNPPLVCAHGGDASKAFPNTMAAYHIALRSQVDCIEIDVSRSADGVLFALHDRDLQRLSENSSSKIKELDASHNITIPTMEDALQLITSSVQKVVVDAKIGPPSYEKGLAHDLISVVGYIVMMNFSTGIRTNLLRMRGADVVGIYHGLVDESVVKILHRRKRKVYAWTVDDEAEMHKMLKENVDAIITSDPSLLQSSMREIRKKCLLDGYSLEGS